MALDWLRFVELTMVRMLMRFFDIACLAAGMLSNAREERSAFVQRWEVC
jgi:hypothetical protein